MWPPPAHARTARQRLGGGATALRRPRNADVTGRGPTMRREGAYKSRDEQGMITRAAARSRCRGRGAHPYGAVAPRASAPRPAAAGNSRLMGHMLVRPFRAARPGTLLAFLPGPPPRGGSVGYPRTGGKTACSGPDACLSVCR
jgi:hypothetical protein